MFLKAILVCDDVRLERGGTLTLVGVHNERLIVPPGDGPIHLPQLAFVLIVGGLAGRERVGFRQRLRGVDEALGEPGPLAYERHDPRADEHNLVFGDAPMVFPGAGTYEVVVDVEADRDRSRFVTRFTVERAAPG